MKHSYKQPYRLVMVFRAKPNFRLSNIVLVLSVFSMVFILCSNIKVTLVDETYRKNLPLTRRSRSDRVFSEFYEKRNSWNTSNLGSMLFKKEYPMQMVERYNKTFVILIWKRWEFLQRRHIYYFGHKKHDPFEGCSVNNCIFTGNGSLLNTADAVVVHLHTALIPETEERNPKQKWIFLDDESPKNSFAMAKYKPTFTELANLFNWSMTYRSDADIPVPYGRTIALDTPVLSDTEPINQIVPNWKNKRRDVLLTILISNCAVSYRMDIIKNLKSLLKLDVYGACGDKALKNRCPGHFKSDCKTMSEYLFYLALENTKCKEYITEKMFYHAYARGAIPVIQGPSIEDCEKLLPPNSYLHIDNYENLQELADDIISISNSDERLLSYHEWRKDYEVLNEHGYFGSKSYHLCRLCEAMNYNDMKTSVYSEKDLRKFLDKDKLCRKK